MKDKRLVVDDNTTDGDGHCTIKGSFNSQAKEIADEIDKQVLNTPFEDPMASMKKLFGGDKP